MQNCPKCNESLNADEKASGRCFSCGATFSSSIPKDKRTQSMPYQKSNRSNNAVATAIKTIGIIIIVLGTIGSAILAKDNYSFYVFLYGGFISVVSGILYIGIAEIINLLESIKEKL